MDFKIKSNSIKVTIGGNGGAPAPPTPAPVTVYDNWRPAVDSALAGFVTDDWEEVTNNGD